MGWAELRVVGPNRNDINFIGVLFFVSVYLLF